MTFATLTLMDVTPASDKFDFKLFGKLLPRLLRKRIFYPSLMNSFGVMSVCSEV